MRFARDLLLTSALLATAGGVISCGSEPSSPTGQARYVEPSSTAIGPGKTVQFRSSHSPRVRGWSVLEGSGHGIISERGLYRAPFIRPASPGATIVAEFLGFTATANVDLEASPPEPLDCCGPNQSHLPDTSEFVHVDELPEPVVRVNLAYPDSAREAGVDGTVLIRALVCSTGQIYSVHAAKSIPLLDGAAMEAIQQWVFRPARADGQPVAVWVVITCKFSLHEPAGVPTSVTTILPAASAGR